MNGRLLSTLAGGLCLVALFGACRADARDGEFLAISDIHFNALHGLEAEDLAKLKELPADQWRDFFERLKQPPVRLGSDSNYTLMASALTAAAGRIESPAFVLFGGDFLSHDWQSRYNALSSETIADDPQAYREFTVKALCFIAGEFRERFPRAVVLPTLGNDDSFCQDYWIQANGTFLDRFAEIWRPLLGEAVDPVAFDRSFSSLGCYVADLPGLEGRRLIVLNSVLCSGSYCSSYHAPGAKDCRDCTNRGTEPGTAALDWLEQSLLRSQEEKRTVWLLMHVPPGLDSYKEERADGKCVVAGLWKEAFLDRYLEVIDRYRSILQISFAGHTHMDDFRLDRIGGKPVLLHKIVPSVSPVFGNNPAFQVYRFDSETGELTDWQTHCLDLADADGNSSPPAWSKEYDARQAYRFTAISAESAAGLFGRIRDDPAGQEAASYRAFFRVGAKPIPESDLRIYACAILNAKFADYSDCVSAEKLPVPARMESPARLRRAAGGLGDPKP